MAQTIYSAALSDADKKRLQAIAQTQGAAATSSLALQMANAQNTTTPTPQGATTPPTSQGAVTTPTNTGGAVPAWVQEAQAQSQANKALTEQQHQLVMALSSGDVNTANQILRAQSTQQTIQSALKSGNTQAAKALMKTAQAQSMQLNPYQAELASATAPTSTLGGRTEDGKYRLSDGRVYDTLQEAVNANAAGTGGNAAGKPMTNGSGFLAADGRTGKITYGSVFGTRVTDAEGNTHWLDPDHQYFKSSNGYVYDATEATDLELARHGLYRTELGGKTVVMPIPDNLAAGFALNWDKLEADHIQEYGRAPLSADELYGPDEYTGVYAGTSGGAAPGGTSPGNRGTSPSNIGGVTNYPGQPVQTGTTQPSTNYPPVQNIQPGQNIRPSGGSAGGSSGYTPSTGGGTVPSGGETPLGGTGYTPYQMTLDQFDYGTAPEWTGGQDETWKDIAGYDYGTAPEWEGSEYENEQAEILKNAQNMQWTGSAYDQRGDELLEQSLQEYGGSQYDPMRDRYLEQYGEEWQGSPYQQERDDYAQKAANLQWNYDPNTDPVWQALQKQYRREGQRATQDTLGKYAAMTGGTPSSYAVTAASQAGDYYAAQLSDRLPQLYNDAYNRYLQEFQRQLGLSDIYGQFDATEYDRWHDQKGRNLELADAYNQLGQQDYERYQNRMNQLAGGADAYYQRGQTDYNRFLDEYDRQLGMADRYGLLGERDYGRYQDRLGQFNTDREFRHGVNRETIDDAERANQTAYSRYLDSLGQFNADRNFIYGLNRDARGDYENDRDFAEDVRRNNRDFDEDVRRNNRNFDEDVRRYGLDYALQSQAQDFDQWYKQQGLSMDQAQMAFDQWYKQQGLSLEYEQMVFDQWYKKQVLGQNQQEIDNDYAYKQGVLGQNQQEIDFDQSYKTTAYQDEIARTDKERADQQALERAQRYAALGNYGPLAELWGMTEDEVRRLFEGDGMDAEQAYSGGSSSPFDETEIPSGTTPKNTPPPPGDGDEGDGDETPDDQAYQKIRSKYGNDVAMEVWNLAGQPWYSSLKALAGKDKAAALDEIYYRVEAGQISEQAIEPLLDMLGLNMSSVTYKPSYRVASVGGAKGGSFGNNIADIGTVRG